MSELPEKVTDLSAGAFDLYLAMVGLPPIAALSVNGVRVFEMVARSFARKFKAYFGEAAKAPEEAIREFVDSLYHKGTDELEDFWSNQVQVIHRLDGDEKAIIGGKLLRALIENKITLEQYSRSISILEPIIISDILYLLRSYKSSQRNLPVDQMPQHLVVFPEYESDQEQIEVLVQTGLIATTVNGGFVGGKTVQGHRLTKIGQIIFKFGFA